ncbi:MAG: DUF4254 domain-containing protein [Candidatus Kapabacteria bacterium]|nr:DUF4254 domain-containing protein [Candidatus Kapabacteria bacterium]
MQTETRNTETLGALIDKLSIVNLKLWHCQELLHSPNATEQNQGEERTKLEAKNTSLLGQRERLIAVIDEWVKQAVTNPEGMLLANPQNKIYGRFRTDEQHA